MVRARRGGLVEQAVRGAELKMAPAFLNLYFLLQPPIGGPQLAHLGGLGQVGRQRSVGLTRPLVNILGVGIERINRAALAS